MDLKNAHIAFVNLSHRKDRLEHMQKELTRVGLNAERFEAIKTTDESWNRYPYQTMFNRTRGAIGCYLSQMAVMQQALHLGKDAVVLEDDVHFCEDWDKRVEYFSNFLSKNDWDIFWLSATFHVNKPYWHNGVNALIPNRGLYRDAECTNDPRIFRTYAAFCTYGYIVKNESIEKVLRMLTEQLSTSIGIDFSMILMQPDLLTYAMVGGSIRQIDNQSDIGQGWTIFSGFSRMNGTLDNSRYWFTEKMEDFNPETFDWAETKK